MPKFTLKCILEKVKSLKNKKVLFFGITYKSDVQDTRYSPATILAKNLIRRGANIYFNDDLSLVWDEVKNSKLHFSNKINGYDIIIFYLKTKISTKLNFSKLVNFKGLLVDVSNTLSKIQQRDIKLKKLKHSFIGNFSW